MLERGAECWREAQNVGEKAQNVGEQHRMLGRRAMRVGGGEEHLGPGVVVGDDVFVMLAAAQRENLRRALRSPKRVCTIDLQMAKFIVDITSRSTPRAYAIMCGIEPSNFWMLRWSSFTQ